MADPTTATPLTPQPPEDAVRYLRANPTVAHQKQFDDAFGAGAAQRILPPKTRIEIGQAGIKATGPQAPKPTIGNYAMDAAVGVVGGIADGLREMGRAVKSGLNSPSVAAISPVLTTIAKPLANAVPDVLPHIENTTLPGHIVHGFAQFGTAFVGPAKLAALRKAPQAVAAVESSPLWAEAATAARSGKVAETFARLRAAAAGTLLGRTLTATRSTGPTVVGRIADSVISGGAKAVVSGVKGVPAAATASAIGFDPAAERLSNIAQDLGVEYPLRDYLAASPKDTEADGRLKNAVEWALIGPIADVTLGAAGGGAKSFAQEVLSTNAVKAARAIRAARTDAEQALKDLEAEPRRKPTKPKDLPPDLGVADTALAERSTQVAASEASLSGREGAVAAKETAAAGKDAALSARESAVAGQEVALASRETAVAGRESAVTGQEAHAAAVQAEAQASATRARTAEDAANQHLAEAAQKEADATTRLDAVAGQEQAVAGREQAVAGREQAVAGREQAVASRDALLTQRENAIPPPARGTPDGHKTVPEDAALLGEGERAVPSDSRVVAPDEIAVPRAAAELDDAMTTATQRWKDRPRVQTDRGETSAPNIPTADIERIIQTAEGRRTARESGAPEDAPDPMIQAIHEGNTTAEDYAVAVAEHLINTNKVTLSLKDAEATAKELAGVAGMSLRDFLAHIPGNVDDRTLQAFLIAQKRLLVSTGNAVERARSAYEAARRSGNQEAAALFRERFNASVDAFTKITLNFKRSGSTFGRGLNIFSQVRQGRLTEDALVGTSTKEEILKAAEQAHTEGSTKLGTANTIASEEKRVAETAAKAKAAETEIATHEAATAKDTEEATARFTKERDARLAEARTRNKAAEYNERLADNLKRRQTTAQHALTEKGLAEAVSRRIAAQAEALAKKAAKGGTPLVEQENAVKALEDQAERAIKEAFDKSPEGLKALDARAAKERAKIAQRKADRAAYRASEEGQAEIKSRAEDRHQRRLDAAKALQTPEGLEAAVASLKKAAEERAARKAAGLPAPGTPERELKDATDNARKAALDAYYATPEQVAIRKAAEDVKAAKAAEKAAKAAEKAAEKLTKEHQKPGTFFGASEKKLKKAHARGEKELAQTKAKVEQAEQRLTEAKAKADEAAQRKAEQAGKYTPPSDQQLQEVIAKARAVHTPEGMAKALEAIRNTASRNRERALSGETRDLAATAKAAREDAARAAKDAWEASPEGQADKAFWEQKQLEAAREALTPEGVAKAVEALQQRAPKATQAPVPGTAEHELQQLQQALSQQAKEAFAALPEQVAIRRMQADAKAAAELENAKRSLTPEGIAENVQKLIQLETEAAIRKAAIESGDPEAVRKAAIAEVRKAAGQAARKALKEQRIAEQRALVKSQTTEGAADAVKAGEHASALVNPDIVQPVALQALRHLSDKDLDLVLSVVRSVDDPIQQGRFLNWAITQHNWLDNILSLRLNWMLSNPLTHGVNASGNLFGFYHESAREWLAGAATPLTTADPKLLQEGAMKRMIAARTMARVLTDASEVWKAAKLAFSTGRSITDPHDFVRTGETAAGSHYGSLDLTLMRALTQDGEEGKAILLSLSNLLGSGPTRALLASDELFKRTAYNARVRAKAEIEAEAQGLVDDATTHYVQDVMEKAYDPHTGAATDKEALAFAQRTTYTQDPSNTAVGVLTRGLMRVKTEWSDGNPILKFASHMVLPFLKTPGNVLDTAWKTTPLNLANIAEIGSKDPAVAADAIARLTLGAVYLGTGYTMVKLGTLTGRAPDDKATKEMWLKNFSPYSVKAPNGEWIPISRFTPLSDHWMLIADMMQAGQLAEDQGDPEKAYELAGHWWNAMGNRLKDRTALLGLNNFLAASLDPDPNSSLPERVGQQMAMSFVPGVVGATNFDPYTAELRSVVDAVYSRIPGYSKTLDPQYNILGEPKVRGTTFIPTTKEGTDPLALAIYHTFAEVGKGPGVLSPVMNGVDLRDYAVWNPELGRNQSAFSAIANAIAQSDLRASLTEITSDPEWNTVPPTERYQYITSEISRAREEAIAEVLDRPEWEPLRQEIQDIRNPQAENERIDAKAYRPRNSFLEDIRRP